MTPQQCCATCNTFASYIAWRRVRPDDKWWRENTESRERGGRVCVRGGELAELCCGAGTSTHRCTRGPSCRAHTCRASRETLRAPLRARTLSVTNTCTRAPQCAASARKAAASLCTLHVSDDSVVAIAQEVDVLLIKHPLVASHLLEEILLSDGCVVLLE